MQRIIRMFRPIYRWFWKKCYGVPDSRFFCTWLRVLKQGFLMIFPLAYDDDTFPPLGHVIFLGVQDFFMNKITGFFDTFQSLVKNTSSTLPFYSRNIFQNKQFRINGDNLANVFINKIITNISVATDTLY